MAKLIVSIDDELHRAFRIKCLQERKTMKEKISEYIEGELSEVLEMDGHTLKEFLGGKAEIEHGAFITLERAKKKYKIQ